MECLGSGAGSKPSTDAREEGWGVLKYDAEPRRLPMRLLAVDGRDTSWRVGRE